MNDNMQTGMAEATRLTRAGQLAEATALIRHTLGLTPHRAVPESGPGSAPEPLEAKFHDGAAPASPEPARRVSTSRIAVPAALAKVFSPGAFRLPGSSGSARGLLVTPDVAPSSVHAGGQFVEGSYTNAAGTRPYKLYIPSGYTGQALPLVVMLHGCTQTPVDFAAGTGMNLLAEKKLFLVAYPEQVPSANTTRCWNWFQPSDQHRGAGEPSLIAGITRQIMSTYQVDASLVFVAGLSAGGAMAMIMATTYPDLYTAVGVHSGLAYGAAHDLPSAFAAMTQGAAPHTPQRGAFIPLIVFHGDRDTTVATVNADSLLETWLQRADAGQGAVQGSPREARVKQGHVPGGHAYTRFIYDDSSGRSLVEKWIIHQAGHAWSGGNPGCSYTEPKGPDASAEMVRFFIEHPAR